MWLCRYLTGDSGRFTILARSPELVEGLQLRPPAPRSSVWELSRLCQPRHKAGTALSCREIKVQLSGLSHLLELAPAGRDLSPGADTHISWCRITDLTAF